MHLAVVDPRVEVHQGFRNRAIRIIRALRSSSITPISAMIAMQSA